MSRAEGFTLIEVAVVFAIIAFVAAIGIPLGLDSYRHYLLSSEARNLLTVFRRAQTLAMANTYGASFGVKLQSGSFTIFRGSSFAGRDQSFDEDYLRSGAITVTGFDEVVFSPLSGAPSVISTITVSNSLRSMDIIINSHGTIIW